VNVLHGIGVGPGAPDLLTLRAIRTLGRCAVVVGPRPRAGESSLAVRIAGPHLFPTARVEELVFPMVRDPQRLREAWDAAALRVLELLEEGNVGFLTLGDASLYSTWTYLRAAVLARRPDQVVATVPGITSFCAAAALAELPLVEGDESLLVVPWASRRDRPWLREALEQGEACAFLKVADRLDELDSALRGSGRTDSVLVSRATLPEESLGREWQEAGDRPDGYLAVVLSRAEGSR